MVNGRGSPLHVASAVQGRLGGESYLKVAVSAGKV